LEMSIHEKYMQYCLQLAVQGQGHNKTNPLVGCVIVYQDKIIAQGYHQSYGEAHAEVNAFAQIADETILKESTVYVNLEPCSHQGKTPPCTLLFKNAPCKTLVVGMLDPNPLVAGKGIAQIENLGIEVISGVLQQQCETLNEPFVKSIKNQKPYVIAKWAQSADGFIGISDERTEISNALVNLLAQKWRTEIDCYLIGHQTLKTDNPQLTVREIEGRNPARAVIGRIKSLDFKFFNDNADLFVFTNEKLPLAESSLKSFAFKNLDDILNTLYENTIGTVMIEGGAKTIQSFLDAGLVDEIRCITNLELILNTGVIAPQFTNFSKTSRQIMENNAIDFYHKK